jgi:hypothetical protein
MSEAEEKKIAELEEQVEAMREMVLAVLLGTEGQRVVVPAQQVRDAVIAGDRALIMDFDKEQDLVILGLETIA